MNQPHDKSTFFSNPLPSQNLMEFSTYATAPSETVRRRVRLCLILKLLSSSLDPVERIYLRMIIRECVSQTRGSNIDHPQQQRFDNTVELQIRRQVGEARWCHCEALVERLLATKNWTSTSSTVLKLPQQGSYW